MNGYPALSVIEARWRASGSGVCVIVEGETDLDDPWFYNRWFGDRAREITFFPQDGVEQVAEAVRQLRASLGDRCVYGILDRDFEPDVVHQPFPADGLVRTLKYTLENYLLDAGCWFRYIGPHTQRRPRPGWQSVQDVQARIEDMYRVCLPLSAYNWTLRHAHGLDEAAFANLRDADRRYKVHPTALQNIGDVPTHLRSIRAQMNMSDDLGRLYSDRLADLQNMPLGELEQVVSGKYVLTQLREGFPIPLINNRNAWDDVLSAYMSFCVGPPADLATLISLILQDAQRVRAPAGQ